MIEGIASIILFGALALVFVFRLLQVLVVTSLFLWVCWKLLQAMSELKLT